MSATKASLVLHGRDRFHIRMTAVIGHIVQVTADTGFYLCACVQILSGGGVPTRAQHRRDERSRSHPQSGGVQPSRSQSESAHSHARTLAAVTLLEFPQQNYRYLILLLFLLSICWR